jgi:rRNA-processing protein FCF1
MTNTSLDSVVAKYATKGILVDTNILLLYCVGTLDPRLIGTFKRTNTFAVEDFDLLVKFQALFAKVVTTPNILTEVNSFGAQLGEPVKGNWFRQFAGHIEVFDERPVISREVAQGDQFSRFGLTDLGILEVATGRFLVLTDDFRLSQFLTAKGIDVVNFNHLRPYSLAQSNAPYVVTR